MFALNTAYGTTLQHKNGIKGIVLNKMRKLPTE